MPKAPPPPLTEMIVEFPLTGGLNQKDDPELTSKPVDLTNALYRKSGSIQKRHGFACISNGNARLDGTTMPTPELLTTAQNGAELLRVGFTDLDTYKPIGSSDWVKRGLVSEAAITSVPLASAVRNSQAGGTASDTPVDATVCVEGNYQITVYASLSGTLLKVLADVLDLTTGVLVLARYVVFSATSTGGLGAPRCVGNGSGEVCIAWAGASSSLSLAFLATSTMTFAYATIASGDMGSVVFDLCQYGGNYYAAYQSTAAQLVRVQGFYSGGSLSGVTIPGSLPGDVPSLASITIRGFAGEKVWVLYCYSYQNLSTFANYYGVNLAAINASGLTYIGQTQMDVSPDTTYFFPYVGIERLTATSVLPIWTAISTAGSTVGRTSWNESTLTGTTWTQAYGSNRVMRWFALLSRPFRFANRIYVLVQDINSIQCSQFLVDLMYGTAIPVGTTPRLVAVTYPGQIPGIANLSDFPRLYSVSDVAILPNGTEFVIGSQTQTSAAGSSATTTTRTQSLFALHVVFYPTRQAEDTVNGLVLGGGYLAGYDGIAPFELGFAHAPDAARGSVTQTATGALTTGKTYYYLFCFAWTDAKGNVHRSAPSGALSVTLTGGNGGVNGFAPTLHLTNKTGTTNDSPVLCEVYRTTGSPGTAIYYHLGNVQNDPSVDSVAFSDTIADIVLSTRAQLYAQPGGSVLDNVIPSGACIAHIHQNAVFAVSNEDSTLWISKALVAGEGISFNDTLVLAPFQDGKITGIISLDTILIIFKSDSIYYLTGTPPNDLGASTLSVPLAIQSEVGCTDPNSINFTSKGVEFYSSSGGGMYLLTPGSLEVMPIGKAVEDTLGSGATFCTALTKPNDSLARLVLRGVNTYSAINWDYFSNSWSRDTWRDADIGGGSTADVRGATVWNGSLVWITAAGRLYQEQASTFVDSSKSGTLVWVPMSFTTPLDHVLGLQSWKRVWNVSLIGSFITSFAATVTIVNDLHRQQVSWTDTETYGFPDAMNDIQLRIKPAQQKAQKYQISFSDSQPTSGVTWGTGQGMSLRAVSLSLGVKQGFGKVRNSQSK